jgi:hypothetical protein
MLTPEEALMLFLMVAPLLVLGAIAWIIKFFIAFVKFLYKISRKK